MCLLCHRREKNQTTYHKEFDSEQWEKNTDGFRGFTQEYGIIYEEASTPSQFWEEATLTVVYAINWCPSLIVQNQTPYDMLFGSSPSFDLLRVFGCVCDTPNPGVC